MSNKMQITILLAASTTAHYAKPFTVYPAVQPRCELHDDYHQRFLKGYSESALQAGWT